MRRSDREFKADATLACSATGSPGRGSWVLETRLEFKVRTVKPQREAKKKEAGPPAIVPCMYVGTYICMYV